MTIEYFITGCVIGSGLAFILNEMDININPFEWYRKWKIRKFEQKAYGKWKDLSTKKGDISPASYIFFLYSNFKSIAIGSKWRLEEGVSISTDFESKTDDFMPITSIKKYIHFYELEALNITLNKNDFPYNKNIIIYNEKDNIYAYLHIVNIDTSKEIHYIDKKEDKTLYIKSESFYPLPYFLNNFNQWFYMSDIPLPKEDV